MSDTHNVSKMVGIYKKLFLVLAVVTAIGIGIAFLHLPIWLALVIAFGIMLVKGKVVLDSFKFLLAGRHVLIITFALTGIFFGLVVLLPLFSHEGPIVGTQDISKEIQMEQSIAAAKEKPAEGHHGN